MSDESKKIEKIEQEAKQEVQELKSADLSEQDLDKVAGGSKFTLGNKSGTPPPPQ